MQLVLGNDLACVRAAQFALNMANIAGSDEDDMGYSTFVEHVERKFMVCIVTMYIRWYPGT